MGALQSASGKLEFRENPQPMGGRKHACSLRIYQTESRRTLSHNEDQYGGCGAWSAGQEMVCDLDITRPFDGLAKAELKDCPLSPSLNRWSLMQIPLKFVFQLTLKTKHVPVSPKIFSALCGCPSPGVWLLTPWVEVAKSVWIILHPNLRQSLPSPSHLRHNLWLKKKNRLVD